jgi:hypothetical protein
LPLLYHAASGKFWIGPGNVAGWAVLYLGMENDPQVGNAVMGYYFDNPVFPQDVRNSISYELLPSDFPGSVIPSSMDIAMGLLEDNHGRLDPGSNPVLDRVYFSLTTESAHTLFIELSQASALLDHVSVANYNPPGGTYTGATIFEARFDNTGQCVGVLVCEDYVSIGLGLTAEDADIDALGVANPSPMAAGEGFSALDPQTLQYVFSLDGPDLDEELLVAAIVSGTRHKGPLLGNNGAAITGNGGSLQGMVKTICGQDPHVAGLGYSAYGEPDDHGDPGLVHCLSLSLAARNTAPWAPSYPRDQFVLTGVVSGWGGWAPEDSLFCVRMEIVGGNLNGVTTYSNLWFRAATDDYKVFSLTFDVPWIGTEVNGVAHADAHRCRFSVLQGGVSQPPSHAPTESFRSLILRAATHW